MFIFFSGFEPKPDFMEDSQKLYDSEPATLSTVNEVNEWVKKATNGYISEFLTSLPINPVMMLINAMHFKGQNKHQVLCNFRSSVNHVSHYSHLLHYPPFVTKSNKILELWSASESMFFCDRRVAHRL